jgi:hypothetical protein
MNGGGAVLVGAEVEIEEDAHISVALRFKSKTTRFVPKNMSLPICSLHSSPFDTPTLKLASGEANVLVDEERK